MSELGFTIVTIIAIIVGPISAVFITRWLDVHRAKKDRRWDIFRNLMRYRETGGGLHAEFVGALNLLEVEFRHDPEVIKEWKNRFESFERPDDSASQRASVRTRLLDEIAKSLGVQIAQIDIFSGAYNPRGWELIEEQNRAIRAFANDIALGKKALSVIVHPPSPQEATGAV